MQRPPDPPIEAVFLDWRETIDLMRRYSVARSPEPTMAYAQTGIHKSLIPLELECGAENDQAFKSHRPCFSESICDDLIKLGLTPRDINVLAPTREARCSRVGVRCSIFGSFRPPNSFIRVTKHIYILSPEATFYRMHFCPHLCFAQRVFLAMELCGSFTPIALEMRRQVTASIKEWRTVLDTSPIHVPSTIEREEVTSTQKLRSYLHEMDNLRQGSWRGPKHLLSAYKTLQYVSDHSASPMESLLMCICCLPRDEAGCEFPLGQFNVVVGLDEQSKHISRKENVRVDIYWPTFGLEYDSDEWHSGIAKLHSDATRRLTLADGSFTLVTVTRDQLTDHNTAELLLLRIAQNLGEKPPCQDFDSVEMRRDLRDLLLSNCTAW